MCLGVPCCTQKISSSIWHSISRDSILNFCRLSNGPFLNLGATCFRTEWRARANFRRLLLRDSPSSQPPSLPKFNFGTATRSQSQMKMLRRTPDDLIVSDWLNLIDSVHSLRPVKMHQNLFVLECKCALRRIGG